MNRIASVFAFLLITANLAGQTALEYNSLGEKKLGENDVYSALEYFSRSIELNPGYHQSLSGIARAYFRLGEYEAALFYIGLAENLAKNNLDYINLEGRIRIGLSDLTGAGDLFRRVMAREPYNLSARLGMAEIDLIENRFTEAETKYLDTLSISPESKRTLLSLLLLYDSTGNYRKGDDILAPLEQLYPFDSDVMYIAAQHYHRKGDLAGAEEKALALLGADSGSRDVRPLLARIYLEKDEPEKSVGFLEEQLKSDRTDLQLRYLLAVSYSRIGRITESLHNFEYILKNAPYDEISRLAAENLAMENDIRTSLEDYAKYHFVKGREFEKQYLYDKALAEYRRGLKINPESVEGRLLYGGIFDKQGYPSKYLDILNLLAWNGYDDPVFLDNKQQIEHHKKKTLADNWGVEQFNLPRKPFLFDVYVKKPDIQTAHSLSELTVADYLQYIMEKYGWYESNGPSGLISVDSDAYRKSHSTGSDYYFIVSFFETERFFSIDVSLHLSRTGIMLDRFSLLRAGNEKVAESMRLTARHFDELLPVRGSIVDLKGGMALINLGILDGIKSGDRFIIVRNGQSKLISNTPWYDIADEDKLGILTVDQLDESVAQCFLENPGFFDLVNTGDQIFLLPEGADIQLDSRLGYNESLKRELLRIY